MQIKCYNKVMFSKQEYHVNIPAIAMTCNENMDNKVAYVGICLHCIHNHC